MNNAIHKHWSILFLLFFTPNLLLSMSSYEWKVMSINKKYYSIFKYGYEVPLSKEDNAALMFWGDALVKMAGLSYSVTNYPEGALVYAKYEEELESARSLMTEEERMKEWEKSCYGRIIKVIKANLLKQFPKDQFETYQEYYNRTFETVKMEFDKKCLLFLNEMYYTMEISIEPDKYNAETQTYVLNIKQRFNAANEKYDVSFGSSIKCSPAMARKIYSIADNGITLKPGDLEGVHWGVVSNKIISLSSFSFHLDSETNVEIVNKDKKLQPLCFSFNLIDENNPHLNNYQFCSDSKIEYTKETNIQIQNFIQDYHCYALTKSDTTKLIYIYMAADSVMMREFTDGLIPCYIVDSLYTINKDIFKDYDEFFDYAKQDRKTLEQEILIRRIYDQNKTLFIDKTEVSKYVLWDTYENEILARRLYKDNRDIFRNKDEVMPYVISNTYNEEIEKRQIANIEFWTKYSPYFRDKSEFDNKIRIYEYSLDDFEENIIEPIDIEIGEYFANLKNNNGLFPSPEAFKKFVLSKPYYKDNIVIAQDLCEEYSYLLFLSIKSGCKFRACKKDKPSKEQNNAKNLMDYANHTIGNRIDGNFTRFFEKWCTLDKEMNKEYMKNGYLFVDEGDFLYAYTSSNYKQYLKELKDLHKN